MDHVLDSLQAYHDGELQGQKMHWVEAHLSHCESCRAELEALQAFSSLLQLSPPAPDLLHSESFVARVVQATSEPPLRPAPAAMKRALETGWYLIPVGLIGAWLFVQTAYIVVAVILLAQSSPATAQLFPFVLPSVSDISWLAAEQCFARSGLEVLWCIAGHVASLGGAVALGFGPLVGIALLYWAWIAAWWVRRQRQVTYVA